MVTTSPFDSTKNKDAENDEIKIHYLEKVIFINLKGNISNYKALRVKRALLEVLALILDKVDVIFDFNNTEGQSVEAKETWRSICDMKQIRKIAFCYHKTSFFLPGYFVKVFTKKNIAFFRTRDEAIQWINR